MDYDGVRQDDVGVGIGGIEGGCVVIAQNNDAQSLVDDTDDDFSNDDSIVDAAIHLASAAIHCRLAEADDDVHSLNSYICFSDP